VGQNPELAWLRLSFFAGQTRMYKNPLAMNGTSFGSAPVQPARQGGWNGEWNPPYWPETPRFDRLDAEAAQGLAGRGPGAAQGVAGRRRARTAPTRTR
jgi:hypothetical protein